MARDALDFPEADRVWLEPYLPSPAAGTAAARPHVTLTFATSLDSALAIAPGVQTALSGPQSKAMTHFLRSRHDAILVGVGTALADDPSLNCRLRGVGGYGAEGLQGQPRPIVLDPACRWTVGDGSKVVKLAAAGRGRGPWVLTAVAPEPKQVQCLDRVGGQYIKLPSKRTAEGRVLLEWETILNALHERGTRSVMVEGGGVVINDLLAQTRSNLVDSVIVTIAPVWLGPQGVIVSPESAAEEERGRLPVARLKETGWHQLGDDVVLCGML